MKKRETFFWVGDGMKDLEPNELVGKEYRAEDGKVWKVVENGYLDVTVEFDVPLYEVLWSKFMAFLKYIFYMEYTNQKPRQ